MVAGDGKRQFGKYYTAKSPFSTPVFSEWLEAALTDRGGYRVLEPFAGDGGLAEMVAAVRPGLSFRLCDIHPVSPLVEKRDSIRDFPAGFRIAITNPPYLGKSRATRLGLDFPSADYSGFKWNRVADLYETCLDRILANCAYAAVIVPASFLNSPYPKGRLWAWDELVGRYFDDTTVPVGLALFVPEPVTTTRLFRNGSPKGDTAAMAALLDGILPDRPLDGIRFNRPNGNLRLKSLDGTRAPSAAFSLPETDPSKPFKPSNRHDILIECPYDPDVGELNFLLSAVRFATSDFFLSPFRGTRRDGMFRRRLQ